MEEKMLNQILLEIREMRTSTNERFEKIDERFEKIDERFKKIDERFDKMSEEIAQEFRDFADIIAKRQNELFEKLDKKIDATNRELKEYKNNVIKGLKELEKAVS